MTNIVKQHAAIALLITILSNFSDCEYCPVSAPTVSVVSKCPTTKTEWDEAASRKKCHLMSAKCGDKTAVYHCLLNQWRNETVEVCASTWYISGFCVIYNTEEMKVIDDFNRDCTNLTDGPCPTRYISTDAYMYQGCYGKRNTSTSLPSTDKQSHVSTAAECTLPAAIVAIIIVLSLLSLGLFVLLVLTCRGIISKSEMEQCIRSFKNTTDEEKGIDFKGEDTCFDDGDKISVKKPLLPSDEEAITTPTDKRVDDISTISVLEQIKKIDSGSKKETEHKDEDKWKKSRKNLKTSSDFKGEDTCFDDGDKISVKKPLLPNDEEAITTPTDKRVDDISTISVLEQIKKIDASDSTRDTSTKDENCLKVYEKERELTFNGRTNTLKDDQTLECNVEDASNNIKDIKTKDEDFIMDSLGGKAISDGRTDSPNEDQTVECNFEDKDVIEDDRLPENDSKVIDTQNMQSSDKEMESTENRSKSQKEPENDEENNAEECSTLNTGTNAEGDLPSNRENKNLSEKEEKSAAEEPTNYVKKMVEKMQAPGHP